MRVVPLREGPLLTDIPGRLRQLAESIESGDTEAAAVLVLIPQDGDWPAVFGFGEHLGDHGNIAVCEMAKIWFVTNVTGRS